MAQITGFNQRGRATQELRAEGFAIAHPSLLLNSRVMLVNTLTGKEIEATVVGRILASADRIADLSFDAWQELGLHAGSEIRIHTNPPVRPRPVAAAPPPVEPVPETPAVPPPVQVQYITAPAAPDPEILRRLAALELWVSQNTYDPEVIDTLLALAAGDAHYSPDPQIITRLRALETWVVLHSPDPEVMNRLMALEAREQPYVPQNTDPQIIERLAALELWVTQQGVDPEVLRRLAALEARPEVQEVREVREVVHVQHAAPPPAPPPSAPVVLHVHPQVTQHVPYFVAMPRVIPGLPDPNTGRIYRLQVGSFSTQQTAERVSRLVSSLGFNVAQEWTGAMHRVLATDVPAALVSSAVQRLGLIGIEQVWVRE
jgi:hypothetical protein